MSEANPPLENSEITEQEVKAKGGSSTFSRVAKYTAVRIITLFFTVVVALYLTVLIANMGGYVDKIQRAQIREDISQRVGRDPASKFLSPEAKTTKINNMIALQEERYGLNQPFVIRSAAYLTNALTLNLGRALQMSSNSGSNSVRTIILERLPTTLLLFGTEALLLFFTAMYFSLILSRKYGSIWDKVLIALTPLSSAPGWFYGIFLVLIFAAILKILPFSGMVDSPPPTQPLQYMVSLGRHMILPITALLIGGIFIEIFAWRTFFLIYSSEDYVDMAKAKGLSSRDIERKYILRPTLPTIITSFALLMITIIVGGPIIETLFVWPGIGRAQFQAIGLFDTPVILGITVVYAYLLAITVFILDFVYALVDPRVKIGGGESKQ
jgi:peptide/nickel transport system permease protein